MSVKQERNKLKISENVSVPEFCDSGWELLLSRVASCTGAVRLHPYLRGVYAQVCCPGQHIP